MAGAVARKLLKTIGVEVLAHTVEIGGIAAAPVALEDIMKKAANDTLRCADPAASKKMAALIDEAKKAGDSLGGIVEGIALNVPAGLGEPVFDNLDGDLAKALLAIPAVKGVEFGDGFGAARRKGSENNDAFIIKNGRVATATNHAGGIEAGMTSAQPIVVRAAMKPISTLARPLESVNLRTRQPEEASYERSDVCAAPAASVILENVVAFEVARALVDKLGGDSLAEMRARWKLFHEMAAAR